MTNREAGINVVREMMGEEAAAKLSASADSNAFGAPIAAYALDQVFADIWTRPGLDRRSRSLISMSVMIAMRQPHEFLTSIPRRARCGGPYQLVSFLKATRCTKLPCR
jgi:4-carboxymuconolactone decarboxylase